MAKQCSKPRLNFNVISPLYIVMLLFELISPLTAGLDHPPVVHLEGDPRVYATPGAVVDLICKAHPSHNITYVWQKDGADLVDLDSYTIQNDQLSVPSKYTGTYHCLAQNDLGMAVSNSTTIVEAEFSSSRFKPPTETISSDPGSTLRIPCNTNNITSVPPPTITWSKQCPRKGRCDYDKVIKDTDPRFTVFNDGSLFIHKVSQEDSESEGIFKCFIKNTVIEKRKKYRLRL